MGRAYQVKSSSAVSAEVLALCVGQCCSAQNVTSQRAQCGPAAWSAAGLVCHLPHALAIGEAAPAGPAAVSSVRLNAVTLFSSDWSMRAASQPRWRCIHLSHEAPICMAPSQLLVTQLWGGAHTSKSVLTSVSLWPVCAPSLLLDTLMAFHVFIGLNGCEAHHSVSP